MKKGMKDLGHKDEPAGDESEGLIEKDGEDTSPNSEVRSKFNLGGQYARKQYPVLEIDQKMWKCCHPNELNRICRVQMAYNDITELIMKIWTLPWSIVYKNNTLYRNTNPVVVGLQ